MRDDTVDTTTTDALGAAPIRRWTGRDLLVLAAISLLAAALRLLLIEQWSFGPGEGATWRAITQPMSGGADGFPASEQSSYPLGFLLLRALVESGLLPGTTEGWLRLPFAFAGCLVTPLVALFARPLLGRASGHLAALAIAVHPAQVAASQTADPAVFAAAAALAAGVLSMRGWRWSSYVAVVVCGGCHPLGWLWAAGLVLATRPPAWASRAPRWSWPLLALAALPLLPDLVHGPAVAALLLAGASFALRLPDGRAFALGALLPLGAGGLWWWFDASVGASARVLAAPVVAVLAAWSCVQFARTAAERLDVSSLARRLVGAAPTVMMIGELLTATFLYFAVYDGGRAAWRDARAAVASARVAGRDLVIVTGRGADVMRSYLRPNHWRDPGRDAHPGVLVLPLAADAAARARQTELPGALFVLQHDERALLGDAADAFVVVALWSGPRADGDGSLYVMRRRQPD
jgi:hypothetical protein